MSRTEVVHKIGDANITDEAIDRIVSWQQHDNDNLSGHQVDMLKAVSFIARASENLHPDDREKAMTHIIVLSGIAEELEVFKK